MSSQYTGDGGKYAQQSQLEMNMNERKPALKVPVLNYLFRKK